MDAEPQTVPDPAAEAAAHSLRARIAGGRRPMLASLPDAIFAAVLAAASLTAVSADGLPAMATLFMGPHLYESLMFALMVEGGFLLLQGTVADIATRLEKRPPLWAVLLIAAGLILFSSEARQILTIAWAQGIGALIPLLLSLAQRFTMLWSMPSRSRIEKIAARALISNRIVTGIALCFISLILVMASTAFGFNLGSFSAGGPAWTFAAGAVYFAIAAYDDWRVRRPAFEKRPKVLFRYEVLRIHHLDPLYDGPKRVRSGRASSSRQ
jgi:hypothetical protein